VRHWGGLQFAVLKSREISDSPFITSILPPPVDCRSKRSATSAPHCLFLIDPTFIEKLRLRFLYHVSCTGEEGEETEVESPKIYEPIGSFKELSDRLEMHQQQYNESIRGAKMDLVFFKVG